MPSRWFWLQPTRTQATQRTGFRTRAQCGNHRQDQGGAGMAKMVESATQMINDSSRKLTTESQSTPRRQNAEIRTELRFDFLPIKTDVLCFVFWCPLRWWLVRFSLMCGLLVVSCQPSIAPKPASPISEPTSPLHRGVRYLLDHQSADGAWRSQVYGHFRDGDSLTPLIVISLQNCPQNPEIDGAIRKGCAWLMKPIAPDGSIDSAFSLSYPVYTAALAVGALNGASVDEIAARRAWSRQLQSWQMTEEIGWHKTDWQYGGWGYSGIVPQKPAHGPVPEALDANLSATAYALEALPWQESRLPIRSGRKRESSWNAVKTLRNIHPIPTTAVSFLCPTTPFATKQG